MRYRLYPYHFGLRLQDGYEGWKLCKYNGYSLWQVVEAPNPNREDSNVVNQREGLPPMYYVVKKDEDVLNEVKKYLDIKSVEHRTIDEITFEA